MTIALGVAATATNAAAQAAPPANRLALVVGEAAYSGDALPTASADAALIARSLAGAGFDVTELHDLGTADLTQQYQGFVAKVAAAPPGAAVTVYFAGLGVAVGCDDYLLPVDAQIATEADVPRIALSMTRVMRDLAQTQSQLRLVMLDGARPVPGSVSAVAFPRGLIPLTPPAATTFALSAEIHDYESPPKPGDANDAYATAFVTAAQLPLTDIESVMRETRVIAHQATGGAQTPWQETNPSEPPFTFPLNADPAQVQAAVATLPNSTTPIGGLDPESAYWAAVWRNDIPDYQAYLAAFGAAAAPERKAVIENLLQLLQQPNPQCQASAPPPPPPTIIAGPACPDGFYAQGGFDEAYCAPLAPPPALVCPPGFVSIPTDDGMGCAPFLPPPVLVCPPRFHPIDRRYCGPDIPPPFCPPGFRPVWHDGLMACVRNGPPPPICPFGTHPVWNGAGYVCGGNPPPPIPCPNGQPSWRNGQWSCLPPPPPSCPGGQTQQWINGKVICGVFRPPVGPTPCPFGFIPSHQGGPGCIPAHVTVPTPTLAPPIFRTPTPTLTLPPKLTPLPTLTPTPTPLPTLTGPVLRTPIIKTPTPTPTLTSPIIRVPIVRTPTPTPKFTPLIVHTPVVTPKTPVIVRTARPVVIEKPMHMAPLRSPGISKPPPPHPRCGGPGQPRCP
ncbi:MAG: caspase family protein [Roseiarcus sp.]|jgi:hypothetical protein